MAKQQLTQIQQAVERAKGNRQITRAVWYAMSAEVSTSVDRAAVQQLSSLIQQGYVKVVGDAVLG